MSQVGVTLFPSFKHFLSILSGVIKSKRLSWSYHATTMGDKIFKILTDPEESQVIVGGQY